MNRYRQFWRKKKSWNLGLIRDYLLLYFHHRHNWWNDCIKYYNWIVGSHKTWAKKWGLMRTKKKKFEFFSFWLSLKTKWPNLMPTHKAINVLICSDNFALNYSLVISVNNELHVWKISVTRPASHRFPIPKIARPI